MNDDQTERLLLILRRIADTLDNINNNLDNVQYELHRYREDVEDKP